MSSLLKTYKDGVIEVGIDEAGLGCLLGAVYAGAVIIDPDVPLHPLVNDSKKMSARQRAIVRDYVEDNLIFAVGFVDEKVVDDLNVLNAKHVAMHNALDQLPVDPEHIIIDGITFAPYKNIEYTTIIKGDAKYASIAYASIMAKEYRDEYIKELVASHPELNERYGLATNMGYPTAQHREGVKKYGPCEYHRKTYRM